MPFLSFLSQRYHYILVERNIELDISNRIGDASATAAASIHPIGDFLRSRKQNNSSYLRTLPDHFIGNGMVIRVFDYIMVKLFYDERIEFRFILIL